LIGACFDANPVAHVSVANQSSDAGDLQFHQNELLFAVCERSKSGITMEVGKVRPMKPNFARPTFSLTWSHTDKIRQMQIHPIG
jgi:hypothetical protein